MNRLIFASIAALLFASCMVYKPSNKESAIMATKRFLDANPVPFVTSSTTGLPKSIFSNQNDFKKQAAELDALADAGLLTRAETKKTVEVLKDAWISNEKVKVEQTILKYELTEKGQKLYNPECGYNALGSKMGGFTVLTLAIEKVLEYHEKILEDGRLAASLRLILSKGKISDWAKDERIKDRLKWVKETVENNTKINARVVLIKSDKGWTFKELKESR